MSSNDDKNSVCSDKEEELEVKDKDSEVPPPRKKKVLKKVVKYVIGNEDDNDEDDDEEEEKEEGDEEDEDEEEEDDEDDEEEDDEDDDDEFDPTIIQYELLKNFFVDEEGNNVASHLGSIAHELRRLNKILSKK